MLCCCVDKLIPQIIHVWYINVYLHLVLFSYGKYLRNVYIWSNYSDLTRPHPKWCFSKGIPLISGKSRWVKYYNLARYIPRTQLTSIFEGQPSKTRPFPFKTRVSWVPGIYTWILWLVYLVDVCLISYRYDIAAKLFMNLMTSCRWTNDSCPASCTKNFTSFVKCSFPETI